MRPGWRLLAAVCLALSEAVLATAAEHGGQDLPVEIHGFLLGAVAGRTTGLRPPRGEGGDFVLGEERIRFDLSGATASGALSSLVKVDLFHDAVANDVDVDLREGYAGWTPGTIDLFFGRQIVTWGVGDLFFVNDVFPKDWESFFSGRPMEYLKLGVDGVRGRYTSDVADADVLVVPFFTADRLPPAERFFLFDPSSRVAEHREDEPATRFSNAEAALRLYRQIWAADVSLYAYRGFWRSPSVRLDDPAAPTTATRFFPALSVYGASAQRTLAGGVVSAEMGYYDSRDDRGGNDLAVPNSQWRFLGAYQRELRQDFIAAIQGYGERMADYGAYRESLPPGLPRQDRFRGVASIRLTRLLDYQTWRLGLFAAYSPTDDDTFLQPEIAYRVTDRLGVSLGANLFSGRNRATFFGQLDRSDNVFANVRFDF